MFNKITFHPILHEFNILFDEYWMDFFNPFTIVYFNQPTTHGICFLHILVNNIHRQFQLPMESVVLTYPDLGQIWFLLKHRTRTAEYIIYINTRLDGLEKSGNIPFFLVKVRLNIQIPCINVIIVRIFSILLWVKNYYIVKPNRE